MTHMNMHSECTLYKLERTRDVVQRQLESVRERASGATKKFCRRAKHERNITFQHNIEFTLFNEMPINFNNLPSSSFQMMRCTSNEQLAATHVHWVLHGVNFWSDGKLLWLPKIYWKRKRNTRKSMSVCVFECYDETRCCLYKPLYVFPISINIPFFYLQENYQPPPPQMVVTK